MLQQPGRAAKAVAGGAIRRGRGAVTLQDLIHVRMPMYPDP